MVRITLALGLIVAAMLYAHQPKVLLGPLDPIAANGSFEAGRALTISDMEPSPEPAVPDLDDPDIFEERFAKSSAGRNRDAILELAASFGPALCEPGRHQQLVAAIESYYGTRKYLNEEFHFRGPRASRFIDAAWTTPEDRRIETFVQQLLEGGYVRARELRRREHPFLLDIYAEYLSPNVCARS